MVPEQQPEWTLAQYDDVVQAECAAAPTIEPVNPRPACRLAEYEGGGVACAKGKSSRLTFWHHDRLTWGSAVPTVDRAHADRPPFGIRKSHCGRAWRNQI